HDALSISTKTRTFTAHSPFPSLSHTLTLLHTPKNTLSNIHTHRHRHTYKYTHINIPDIYIHAHPNTFTYFLPPVFHSFTFFPLSLSFSPSLHVSLSSSPPLLLSSSPL